MLCGLYARVSTDDQHCDLQLSELREYTERRGWKVYSEYVDTGWSGSKGSRPAGAQNFKASLVQLNASNQAPVAPQAVTS
jgi:DNA invertase Pin-like site-specific DNA recombinase